MTRIKVRNPSLFPAAFAASIEIIDRVINATILRKIILGGCERVFVQVVLAQVLLWIGFV